MPSNKNALRRGAGEDIVAIAHDLLEGNRSYGEVERMTVGEVARLAAGASPEDGEQPGDEPDAAAPEERDAVDVARARLAMEE